MSPRILFLTLASFAVPSFAQDALADEPEPRRPVVTVEAKGEDGAVLRERLRDEPEFHVLCVMPCTATATTQAFATHQVSYAGSTKSFKLRGEDGDRFGLSFKPGNKEVGTPLVVGGAVAMGVGVVLTTIGFGAILSQVGASTGEACGTDACRAREADVDAARRTGGTLTIVGFGTLVVGAALLATGIVVGKSTASVRRYPSSR